MVVVLSYFDRRIGPVILLTYPEIEITEEIEKVKQSLDFKDSEGFVAIHDTLVAMNYLLPIQSHYARGGYETVLLSYIVTESEPNEKFYKSHIKETAEKIKMEDDIWQAFIEDHENQEERISRLREIIRDLDIELRMRDITTIGYCIESRVFEDGYMAIPRDSVTREVDRDGDDKKIKSYLMVYKKERDGSFSIKGYPITSNNVYKMEIFTDQINVGMVAKIKQAFDSMLGGRIAYTSGICQSTAVCSFELYFEYDGEKEDVGELRKHLIDEIDSNTPIYPMIIYSIVHTEKTPFSVDKNRP